MSRHVATCRLHEDMSSDFQTTYWQHVFNVFPTCLHVFTTCLMSCLLGGSEDMGLSFPECAISRHSRYLTTIRTKHTSTRHLLAAPTMIMGPDRSRHHMIASAMSLRSCRAAAGLRRPSESRAFLASRSTIYFDDACGSSRDRWTFVSEISPMRRRTGDPKASTTISGIRGMMPSASRRHRRIPSASP